jgi:hypothetical protein
VTAPAARGLPTVHRLWAAAALCVAPLGLPWSVTAGFSGAGTTVYGSCDGSGYCTPDFYVPGYFVPGTHTLVAQSPVRVFLVFAAVALVWVATRRRTARTLRVARLAIGAVLLAAVLAAANSVVVVLVCALGALGLVGPLVRPRRAPARVRGAQRY